MQCTVELQAAPSASYGTRPANRAIYTVQPMHGCRTSTYQTSDYHTHTTDSSMASLTCTSRCAGLTRPAATTRVARVHQPRVVMVRSIPMKDIEAVSRPHVYSRLGRADHEMTASRCRLTPRWRRPSMRQRRSAQRATPSSARCVHPTCLGRQIACTQPSMQHALMHALRSTHAT
jgi:hypothetical protein